MRTCYPLTFFHFFESPSRDHETCLNIHAAMDIGRQFQHKFPVIHGLASVSTLWVLISKLRPSIESLFSIANEIRIHWAVSEGC